MSTHYAQQALENRPTVDDPTGADRNAGIVAGPLHSLTHEQHGEASTAPFPSGHTEQGEAS